MFRKILLIFLFCGLTVLSVVLEYRATAGSSTCSSPRGLCVPVEPPVCEISDCEKVAGYKYEAFGLSIRCFPTPYNL